MFTSGFLKSSSSGTEADSQCTCVYYRHQATDGPPASTTLTTEPQQPWQHQLLSSNRGSLETSFKVSEEKLYVQNCFRHHSIETKKSSPGYNLRQPVKVRAKLAWISCQQNGLVDGVSSIYWSFINYNAWVCGIHFAVFTIVKFYARLLIKLHLFFLKVHVEFWGIVEYKLTVLSDSVIHVAFHTGVQDIVWH